ncbi:hypothetical protein A0O32_1970 [Anoxybacillus flavithermus]|nr:hypothetical protein A0O32_1970 [Anoxybacillus flavithermus]
MKYKLTHFHFYMPPTFVYLQEKKKDCNYGQNLYEQCLAPFEGREKFLIGTIQTYDGKLYSMTPNKFQFLIGTIQMPEPQGEESTFYAEFQFLIGTIQIRWQVIIWKHFIAVSIPHRYDTNHYKCKNPRRFNHVSIPHRYDTNLCEFLLSFVSKKVVSIPHRYDTNPKKC